MGKPFAFPSLRVSRADVAAIADFAAFLDKAEDARLDRTSTALAARSRSARLSPELWHRLSAFRVSPGSTGYLLIQGLELMEEGLRTPQVSSDERPVQAWPAPLATAALLVIGSALGDPVGFADEKHGAIVQEIVPVVGHERRQENSGSVHLQLHTENGFHFCPPDFLGLICLRADPEGRGQTLVSSLDEIEPRLTKSDISVLERPEFRISASSSFAAGKDEAYISAPRPILGGCGLGRWMRADLNATTVCHLAAEPPFERFQDAAREAARPISSLPGDLLLIDNRRALHGRTSFSPRHDGHDRWLRRISVLSDLRSCRGHVSLGRNVLPPLSSVAPV